MALIPLSKFKEIAQNSFSVSENSIDSLINRGFITAAKYNGGTPLYDDYFVSDSDAFNKIFSEYENTQSYLTASELSEKLANKGVNISAGAIEQMAKSNLIESYRVDSGYHLFKPDILINIEEIQAAYDEFEAKEAEEDLDELELFLDNDEDPSDNQSDDEQSLKHEDEFLDDWEEFEEDEEPKKKKKSSQPVTVDTGEAARIEEFKKQEEIKAQERKKEEDRKKSEEYGSSQSSFVPPVSDFVTPPSNDNISSMPQSPSSSEKSSGYGESYTDYLRQSESDDVRRREYDESLARKEAEERKRREDAAKHEKAKREEQSQLRDDSGNFVFTGYKSGEQGTSSPSSSLFPEFDAPVGSAQEKYSPADIKRAEELVAKSYVADIASHNIISQNGMNEIIDYVRSSNKTVELPMKDGSYLKFEAVPSQSDDPYKSSSDYVVSRVEPSSDYSKTTSTVLYSSEQHSTNTSFISVTDAYASGMGVERLESGYKDSEQSKTDNRVLYAIGVMPDTPSFAQNPDGSKDHTSVSVPAGVEYINPSIISVLEQSGVKTISTEAGESPKPLSSFNPSSAHENQFVASAYLGSEEQMGRVLSRVDADRYISNSVSAEEYNAFVNKVQISNVTTDTVLSEAAISRITEIVKSEERKVEVPLRDGSVMTFEPVKSNEGLTDFRVTLQSPSNGDYSTVTSKLIYSSEASETQAVSFGSVYSSYASGMTVDKLEASASTPQQSENDRRVMFAVGAVTAQEVAGLSKNGVAVIPKGVTYIHESVVSGIEKSGTERIKIDNQTRTLSEHRERKITVSSGEISESVFLGSYKNIERVTAKSESSDYFKERFSLSGTSSPTKQSKTSIGSMQDSRPSSSLGGRRLSNSPQGGTRVAVMPTVVRTAVVKPPVVVASASTSQKAPPVKRAPVVIGDASGLTGDYSPDSFKKGKSADSAQTGGIRVAVHKREPSVSTKPQTVRISGRTVGTAAPIATLEQNNAKTGKRITAVVVATGKTSAIISYKENGKRTTIEMLGSEANSSVRFRPANRSGIERQAIVANNRAKSSSPHMVTFTDGKGKTHVAANPEHIRHRAAVNRHIQGRSRGNAEAAYAQGLRDGRLAARPDAKIIHALKTGDFSAITTIRNERNSAAASMLENSSSSALIKKGMHYKDEKRAKRAQTNANFRMIGKQIGRISGLSSSGDYFTTGAKSMFGYTSPIAIIGDLAQKPRAKEERLMAEKKFFESLLADDLKDLVPNLSPTLKADPSTARGRLQINRELKKLSKASFGKNITHMTTFEMKKILKTGKFNGSDINDDQRTQLIVALRLRGYSVRDYSAFNISDNLLRRGMIIKGTASDGKSFDLSGRNTKKGFVQFDLSKRKDISLFRKNLDIASLQFSSELGGLKFSQLSQDQLERLARGKSVKVGKGDDKRKLKPSEALKSAAGTYIKTGNLLKAKTKERQSKKGRFSRFSILGRKLLAGTDAMIGLNAVLMLKDYSKLAMSMVKMSVAMTKSVMHTVKRMYKATIGRIFRAIGNSKLSKTIRKFAHSLKGKIRLKFRETKLGTALFNRSVRRHVRKARRAERKERKAFWKNEKKRAKKISRANKRASFLNKHPRINKITKAYGKGKKIAGNVRGRLNGAKNRLKKIGNAIAKPFRIVAAPFNFVKKLVANIKAFAIKYALIAVVAIAALELILTIISAASGSAMAIIWNFIESLDITKTDYDANFNGISDLEEAGIDSEDDLNTSDVSLPSDVSLMRDRVNFCLQMDTALKIYITTLGDANAYDEKIVGTAGQNPATQEVSKSKEIEAETEAYWYDPSADVFEFNEEDWTFEWGRNTKITELGFKVDDAQAGVNITYYDGDGNVVGARSNAKDIVSLMNAFMTESFAPKGLAKSYVEKLWNFSHAVAYTPKKQTGGKFNGKFIYACDADDPCSPCNPKNYTHPDDSNVTSHKYYCNALPTALLDGQPNTNFYRWTVRVGGGDDDASNVLDYNRAETQKIMDMIHIGSKSEPLRHYSEQGCAQHSTTYCGGKFHLFTESNKPKCSNLVKIDANEGSHDGKNPQVRYFCKGHRNSCSSKCKTKEAWSGDSGVYATLYHENLGDKPCSDAKQVGSSENHGSFVRKCEGCIPIVSPIYPFEVIGYTCAGHKDTDKIASTGCTNVSDVPFFWKCGGHTEYKCNGHKISYKIDECGGYCDGHTFNFCKGHVDIDISVVTLFLDDQNGLTKLGVSKNIDRSYEEIKYGTRWTGTPGGYFDDFGEKQQPYLVETQTCKLEDFEPLYTPVDVFKDIKANVTIEYPIKDDKPAGQYMLPLPDPKNLKEEIRMQMGSVDNKIVANNETVDTLRFLYYYSSYNATEGLTGLFNGLYNEEYYDGVMPCAAKNLDQIIGSYFVAFNYGWQDMNDSSSLDGAGTGSDLDTGNFEGAPKHLAGAYHKFYKCITFDGWYQYSDSGSKTTVTSPDGVDVTYYNKGSIVTLTNIEVNKTDQYGVEILDASGMPEKVVQPVYYAETQHVSRAKAIFSDDWKILYDIDFPGSYAGVISKDDRYTLMKKAWSIKHHKGRETAESIEQQFKPIYDAWANPSVSCGERQFLTDVHTILDVVGKSPNYTDEPIDNIKFVEHLYGKLGKPLPWGTSLTKGNIDFNGDGTVNSLDNEYAVRYIHYNKTSKGNLIKILAPNDNPDTATNESEAKVRQLALGDIIVIANEMYVVMYNECSQKFDGAYVTDPKYGKPVGNVVCVTVAGGGSPRLVAFSSEGLCKPGVGYGYIDAGLY